MTTTRTDDRLAAQERELVALRAEIAKWRASYAKQPLRDDADFNTISGLELEPVYTPLDAAPVMELPGQFPYTRGIHPSGYRGKLWTMRQFAGFGTAEDTNARYKFLLARGQTGLSVAFDFPTLMGYDADHVPKARSGSAAWLSAPWPIWRPCSTGSRSTRSPSR